MMRRVDGLPMVALSCGEFAVAFLVQKGWRDQDIYERKTPIKRSRYLLTRLQVLALYRLLYLHKQIFIP